MQLLALLKSVRLGTWLIMAAILLAAWMLKPLPPRSAVEECREIADALGKTAEGQRVTNIVQKAFAACLAKKAGSE